MEGGAGPGAPNFEPPLDGTPAPINAELTPASAQIILVVLDLTGDLSRIEAAKQALIADIAGGAYPAMINILLALRERDRLRRGVHTPVAALRVLQTLACMCRRHIATRFERARPPAAIALPMTGAVCAAPTCACSDLSLSLRRMSHISLDCTLSVGAQKRRQIRLSTIRL